MNLYLLSGLPGTGKTTIQHELDKRGYDTIDSDTAWGYYGNLETEEPVEPPLERTRDWIKKNGWIWNSKIVRPILERGYAKPLFICGGSRNEEQFYPLFTKIFSLHVPNDVMRARLEARHGAAGTTPQFIERMIEFNENFYERAEKKGGSVIETTKPLKDCVNKILSEINEHQ